MKNKPNEIIESAENKLITAFKQVDEIALFNQNKVLDAFHEGRIALRHFAGTTGYGYDDIGRDGLCKLYATVFGAESALVSPNIVSGTHALTLTLFGLLRPNDLIVSISGKPYDTMHDVIYGKGNGSLEDFGITFESLPLRNGGFDFDAISSYLISKSPKIVYIQRSRGYEWRAALSIDDIECVIAFVKRIKPNVLVVVDNCYGEFIAKREPTQVGADVIVGSLIKNAGGGLAPTGGYIAGTMSAVELISYRMTSPSIGAEVGSYEMGYRAFYQGLFMAPHTTAQAVKGAMLFSTVMEIMGYKVKPTPTESFNDIICSIEFPDEHKLIAFCQSIQNSSPIDGYVTPEPWDMPGYNNKVIMAAGCFVGGASIELSCDSPIVSPYIAYLQGALTYEHAKIAVKNCIERLL